MKYQIIGSSLVITSALEQHIQKHFGKLEKHSAPSLAHVELIDHLHKKHGDKFSCKVEWETLSKNYNVDAHGEDMYKVIIEASKKLNVLLSKAHSRKASL
ncbi:MAG: hypothetical protein UW34_C0017G0001 [Parcubacteria group bacterium GW2011_GWA2_44_15]|nr:MAG: hypothetical protein UW34_C0017G0001 [Parcubacteria group bacterium GW2011_GWA2_44_15]